MNRIIVTALAALSVSMGSLGVSRAEVVATGYSPVVASHSGKCLTVSGGQTTPGASVVQSSCGGAANQQWTVQAFVPGYRLVAQNSNLCLAMSGSNVVQATCTGAAAELWTFSASGAGFQIAGQGTALCLTVTGASIADSAALSQSACAAGQPNQEWVFSGRLVSSTMFVDLVARHSGQCLNVSGGDVTPGAAAIQYPCVGANNEQWSLKPAGGDYQLIAKHSSQCLVVSGSSTTPGAAVVQSTCQGGVNELWTPKAGPGGYQFVAKVSGLCLTVPGGAPGLIATVQDTCGTALYQSWAITDPAPVSAWSPKLTMSLVPVSAANLPNGKVLTWAADGEFTFTGDTGNAPSHTYTSIFDPAQNTFTAALESSTGANMFCPGTSVLFDGTVLVNGGSSSPKTTLYNPATNAWSIGALMNIPRGYQANTVLADGSVLTLGGSWSGSGPKDGEVWSNGTWQVKSGLPVGPIVYPDPQGIYRGDNHAWLFTAANGRVFHAGPSKQMNWITTSGSGTITPAGLRGDDNDSVNGKAVLFDTGKILKTGGAPSYVDGVATTATYVIDVNNGVSVRKTAPMAYARTFANGVVLPTGQIALVGGQSYALPFNDANSILMAELWDPVREVFTRLSPMQTPRNYHSVALLLPDARVFVGGGGMGGNLADHPDVEILSPPYLFNADGSAASRPVITFAQADTANGGTMAVTTNSPVTSFAIIRLSSTTHTVNNDERRLPLAIQSTPAANSYLLSVPGDPGVALPGYYMLFAMNAVGTPSVAKIIHVGGSIAPPTISLTSPAQGATFTAPAIINLVAAVTGTVSSVEFYNGTALLGTAISPPYTYSWNGVGAGNYSLTAKAYGSTTVTSNPVSVTVNSPANLTISPVTLGNGIAGAPYSATLTASGGSGPFTWSISAGALPAGLTLGSTTGVIGGTTAATGTFNFTVSITNGTQTGSRGYSLTMSGGIATITRVQTKHTYPGSSVTFSSNNTAGNTIIVSASWFASTSATPTISDSRGNTYTALPKFTGGGFGSSVGQMIYYATNIAAGSNTITVAGLGAQSDLGLTATEYSGIAASSALGNTATKDGSTGATTTPTSNSFTPGSAGSLLVAAFADETVGQSTVAAGAGYTLVQGDGGHVDGLAEKFNSTVTPQTASFALASSTQSWIMYLAEFRAAGSSGPTLPPAPAGLQATPGNAQVSLTWTAVSGATSYNVKRSTVSGGPYTSVGSPAANSFTNTGLTNGTAYYYVVSAVNGAGEGPNSTQVSATPASGVPGIPAGLQATAGNAQVSLTWTTVSGATSYNVKRSTVSGGPYATVGSPTTNNFTNTGLTNGTTYYYVVSAVNGSGQSANSAQVSATPVGAPPGVPAGLQATAGNAQVSLTWTAVSGATSYNVKRATVSGGPYTTVGSPTTNSFTNTGLTNGTTYFYVVSAVNGSGQSANSTQVSATPRVPGTITRVQVKHTYPGGSVAFTSNNTAGNTIIVAVSWFSPTSTTPIISDTRGNTYAALPKLVGGGTGSSVALMLYYAANIAAGANTITVAGIPAQGDLGVTAMEYSGIASSAPLGITSTKDGSTVATTKTPTSNSFTPGTAGSLLVAAFADETVGQSSVLAGAGFTLVQGDGGHVDAQEEKFNATTTAQTASFALPTTTRSWLMMVAEFKPAP